MTDWMRHGLCVGTENPDDWHPDYENTAVALRLCDGCPVTDECAQYARDNKFTGIWGGLTTAERAADRPRAKCGTLAAYSQHRTYKEAPCGPCYQAHNEQHRAYTHRMARGTA